MCYEEICQTWSSTDLATELAKHNGGWQKRPYIRSFGIK
jgi:hypothetical protein